MIYNGKLELPYFEKLTDRLHKFHYGERRGETWVTEMTDWLEANVGKEDVDWVWQGTTIYVPHDVAVIFRLVASK